LVYKIEPEFTDYPYKWAEPGICHFPPIVELVYKSDIRKTVDLGELEQLSNHFKFVNPFPQ
jgi:hypothetical protein